MTKGTTYTVGKRPLSYCDSLAIARADRRDRGLDCRIAIYRWDTEPHPTKEGIIISNPVKMPHFGPEPDRDNIAAASSRNTANEHFAAHRRRGAHRDHDE